MNELEIDIDNIKKLLDEFLKQKCEEDEYIGGYERDLMRIAWYDGFLSAISYARKVTKHPIQET